MPDLPFYDYPKRNLFTSTLFEIKLVHQNLGEVDIDTITNFRILFLMTWGTMAILSRQLWRNVLTVNGKVLVCTLVHVTGWSPAYRRCDLAGESLLSGQSVDFSHPQRNSDLCTEAWTRQSGPRQYFRNDRGG